MHVHSLDLLASSSTPGIQRCQSVHVACLCFCGWTNTALTLAFSLLDLVAGGMPKLHSNPAQNERHHDLCVWHECFQSHLWLFGKYTPEYGVSSEEVFQPFLGFYLFMFLRFLKFEALFFPPTNPLKSEKWDLFSFKNEVDLVAEILNMVKVSNRLLNGEIHTAWM